MIEEIAAHGLSEEASLSVILLKIQCVQKSKEITHRSKTHADYRCELLMRVLSFWSRLVRVVV